jgi:uncharacterized protein (TIRG00374 family)
LVAAGALLWLTLRQLELRSLARTLADTNLALVAAALVALTIGYACRIERWRLMLIPANPDLRWRDCAGPLLASFAANNVLPLRAGDVMRVFAFNAELRTAPGTVLTTVFVERLLDLLTVIGFLGGGLALFNVASTSLVGVGRVALLTLSLLMTLVLLFPTTMAPPLRLVTQLATRWLPQAGKRISAEMDKGLLTLQHLAVRERMFALIFWSIAAWVAEGVAYWITAISLPTLTIPRASWLALPVSVLATLLPSTPGYLGTFDYFTNRAMVAAGNDAPSAALYALLIHAVVWLPPTTFGGLYALVRTLRVQAQKQLMN